MDECPLQDPPAAVDGNRPPQLNTVICRCRTGCACACSRAGNDADSEGGGNCEAMDQSYPGLTTCGSSTTDDTDSVDGEEGADLEVEIGALGKVKVKTIVRALLEQGRNMCRRCGRRIASSGVSSMDTSGYLEHDDSVVVNLSQRQRTLSSSNSTVSSISVIGGRNMSGSDYLPEMGVHFETETQQPISQSHLHHFTRTPMPLAHQPIYCFNMAIGPRPRYPYATELSIGG